MDRFDLLTNIVNGALLLVVLAPLGPWSLSTGLVWVILFVLLFAITLVLRLIQMERKEERAFAS